MTTLETASSSETQSYRYPSLSASGINATGAAAILNIGHWFSFTGVVEQHAPGSSHFVYRRFDGWKVAKCIYSYQLQVTSYAK